ncbi:MAG: hypothetical protein H7Z21_08080 [Hymenobacter sp.]|nr:hypothetical protein [Hymenobacter sp.]
MPALLLSCLKASKWQNPTTPLHFPAAGEKSPPYRTRASAAFISRANLLSSCDLYPVTVPRRQLQRLGSGRFFEYVADTCLAQQPAEALRVTRSTILFALTHGL